MDSELGIPIIFFFLFLSSLCHKSGPTGVELHGSILANALIEQVRVLGCPVEQSTVDKDIL